MNFDLEDTDAAGSSNLDEQEYRESIAARNVAGEAIGG